MKIKIQTTQMNLLLLKLQLIKGWILLSSMKIILKTKRAEISMKINQNLIKEVAQ